MASAPWMRRDDRVLRRCAQCRFAWVPQGLAYTAAGVSIYEDETPFFMTPGYADYYRDESAIEDPESFLVDPDRVYVTGHSRSRDFPTTALVFQPALSPGAYFNAFLAKLDPAGSSLIYATYLGGGTGEYGMAIAVDAAGYAWVTGYSYSSNFPTTAGAFQRTFGGVYDAFVVKLNPGGTSLVYSTYLGGTSGPDAAQGGNDLGAAAAVADLFLERGTSLVVSRMRRASGSQTLADSADSPFAAMPLAVLIDGGTAGAAEVVAGALQDHDRAVVLGSPSYGRGVSQNEFSLGGGAVLTLTTALWFTPGGRQIQRPPRPATGDTLPRPLAKSDAGRPLVGGGGIVPDRVLPDRSDGIDLALSEARRLLARATTPENVFALLDR